MAWGLHTVTAALTVSCAHYGYLWVFLTGPVPLGEQSWCHQIPGFCLLLCWSRGLSVSTGAMNTPVHTEPLSHCVFSQQRGNFSLSSRSMKPQADALGCVCLLPSKAVSVGSIQRKAASLGYEALKASNASPFLLCAQLQGRAALAQAQPCFHLPPLPLLPCSA